MHTMLSLHKAKSQGLQGQQNGCWFCDAQLTLAQIWQDGNMYKMKSLDAVHAVTWSYTSCVSVNNSIMQNVYLWCIQQLLGNIGDGRAHPRALPVL